MIERSPRTDLGILQDEIERLRRDARRVHHILENVFDPYNENPYRLKAWGQEAMEILRGMEEVPTPVPVEPLEEQVPW